MKQKVIILLLVIVSLTFIHYFFTGESVYQSEHFEMTIIIRTMMGKSLELEVNPHNTVHDIKLMIQKQLDIAPSGQTIIFDGRETQDSSTLDTLEVQNGDTLYLKT